MDDDQQDAKQKAAEKRIERMVGLMLISEGDVPVDCPLREILKQSFSERVLWLEDQTKFSLDSVTSECRACGRCNFGGILSET
jgi:hypothetical protein